MTAQTITAHWAFGMGRNVILSMVDAENPERARHQWAITEAQAIALLKQLADLGISGNAHLVEENARLKEDIAEMVARMQNYTTGLLKAMQRDAPVHSNPTQPKTHD